MTRAIIDRIEEGIVVLELDNRKLITVPLVLVTSEAREGDVVDFDGEYWRVDQRATDQRRSEVAGLIREMSIQRVKND